MKQIFEHDGLNYTSRNINNFKNVYSGSRCRLSDTVYVETNIIDDITRVIDTVSLRPDYNMNYYITQSRSGDSLEEHSRVAFARDKYDNIEKNYTEDLLKNRIDTIYIENAEYDARGNCTKSVQQNGDNVFIRKRTYTYYE